MKRPIFCDICYYPSESTTLLSYNKLFQSWAHATKKAKKCRLSKTVNYWVQTPFWLWGVIFFPSLSCNRNLNTVVRLSLVVTLRNVAAQLCIFVIFQLMMLLSLLLLIRYSLMTTLLIDSSLPYTHTQKY